MATWKEKYNKKYQYKKNKSHNLSDISKDTGVSRSGLQQIYNKGIGAYKTNPQSVRPNVTSKEQWAMARVYSSVMGGKASKIDKKELNMEKGGSTDFNPDGNIKDKVVHASGDAGGMLVGKRHSNGGIKALNKSTGQPLEMEGGEVVITRNAVSDNKKRSFNGKMMTNRQILSSINESGGGVSFADGGQVPNDVKFDCNAEYEYGGKTMCGKDLAYALGGDVYAKGGTIECGSCSWSWDRKDGGDDMYICHKCGTDNTNEYKNVEITIKNNNMKKNNLIKPKRKGKNIMTLAKEIRKKDESWQDALKRAKIEMNKTNSKKSSNIDSELGKLKELIKEDKILKEYNYSKKNTKKSNTRLQKGGDVMSLGIANADAVYSKGGKLKSWENSMKKRKDIEYLRIEKTEALPNGKTMIYYKYNPIDSEEWRGTQVGTDSIYAKGGEITKTGNKGSARWEMKITDDEGNTSSIYAEKKSDLLQYKKMYLAKGGAISSIKKNNDLSIHDSYYAKGGKLSKDDAITKALKLGVDFNKDFHSQSFGNELSELAKETGYRKSKSSSGSLGRSFFNHLQKIYDKNSSYYDSTLNSRGYAKGGEIEDEMQYGYWYVKIKEDENDEEIRNQEVSRLIREGYFSGFDPTWSLEITDIDGDIDEATENEIARLVEEGYTSGEVVMYKYAKGGEIETKREFVEVVNQVKEENEAFPNDFVNVMDSINAILQDRGYEEDDEYTYDVRDEILDRYEKNVLDKQGLRFAKGGKTKRSKHSIMQDRRRVSKQSWEVAYQKRKAKMEKGGSVSYDKMNNTDSNEYRLIERAVRGRDVLLKTKGNKILVIDERNDKIYEYDNSYNNKQKIEDFIDELKSSFEKGRKYADGGTIGEYPRVYIADLEAYNNGELKGEWLDLADYNDSEEFNDAVQDLLDGWGVEEYAIHDVENFPDGMYSEYMGTSDFDEIYDMIELAKNNDLPLDVVMEVVSQYDESAVEEYQGQYEDGEDFAYQMIDEIGLENFNNPQYFVDISDTDRRIMAQEMADSYIDDIVYEDDGERVVEEAGLDVDEYRELDGEDDDKRDEILEEAKEIVRDEYYETWYDGLDDPYDFLVNEQGFYSDEDFFKANFIQIDYGELANALEQDYLFIENDKGLFVFNVR